MKDPKRAVAPVISTILLVAIVVVLATTVSVLVLGVGETVGEPAPATTFDVEQQNETVVATHTSGDSIDQEALAIRGGSIVDAPETVTAGTAIEIEPDSTAEGITIAWEQDQNSAVLATEPVLAEGDSTLVAETDADETIPMNGFGESSEEQYEALEEIALSDPFTLAVEAPELAGEETTEYAVVAYYDEFNELPNDRLAGPSVALEFDEDGIAEVTIGSDGTDADVSTSIAIGSLSGDASLVNNIEVLEEAEAVAVETD